jgi:hypothetical protein
MPADSQGSNFVFAGSTYTVTSVSVTPGGDLLDYTHLGLASGKNRLYQTPALRDDEISIECFALTNSTVTIGSSGALSFATASYTATISSVSVSYAVGELVKTSYTFKVQS